MRSWLLKHVYLGRGIGLFLVFLVLIMGILLPSWGKSKELNRKIATRQKEEDLLINKISVLSTLDTEALASRIEILNRALPPRKDVVLYLTAIDGLSRELGLAFNGISLSPGDVTEASMSAEKKSVSKSDLAPGVHILETEIKISGTKENIYSFLSIIENSSPLMQVNDVKVSKVGREVDDVYTLALKLGMLWADGDTTGIKGVVELFSPQEEEYFGELANLRSFQNTALEGLDNDAGLGKIELFSPILLETESLQQEQQTQESE